MKRNNNKKTWIWSSVPMLALMISTAHLFAQADSIKIGLKPEDLKNMKESPLEFVLVTPGEFTMGSPCVEEGRSCDEGQRRVIITKPFEIGKTEVTQLQYARIMEENPSRFVDPKAADYMELGGIKLNASHPVERVSWYDVQRFLRKLNEQCLNEQCSKYNYRLPTEAEWEYAARGGTTSRYSFGDREQDLEEYAVYVRHSEGKTAPVLSKKENPFGLSDVHGNVWEWCHDWYSQAPEGLEDPVGPTSGSHRVIRGGSWFNSAPILRSARRYYVRPHHRRDDVGFRVVRTAK